MVIAWILSASLLDESSLKKEAGLTKNQSPGPWHSGGHTAGAQEVPAAERDEWVVCTRSPSQRAGVCALTSLSLARRGGPWEQGPDRSWSTASRGGVRHSPVLVPPAFE